MIVDAAMGAAFDRVEAREREAQTAFEPGLPERAYAIVNDGRGGAIYTREGGFSIRDGRVVDDSGRAVLGTTRAGSTLSELRVDGTDLALGRVRDLQVGTDGRVTYRREAIDPRSGAYGSETVVVGRIALARFPIATAMRPVDANHVGAPDGVVPYVGSAADGTFGPMTSPRDGPSVDASLQRLQEAYLALDALRAARVAQGGAEKNAMDLVK
jgi:hypothetical protein